MKKPPHAKDFEAKGYSLERFSLSDTRRIGPAGEIYKYYAAREEFVVHKFQDIAEACQWVEFAL